MAIQKSHQVKKGLVYRAFLIMPLIIYLAGNVLYAQSQYLFQLLDKSSGIADNHVNSIAQDSLGYIWFQNPGVLSRYDGYNFKIFKHNPNDSSRSALNFELGVLNTDGEGSVWITEHHHPDTGDPFILVKYDHKKDYFRKYLLDLGYANVSRLKFERKGKLLWLGTYGDGLFSFDPEQNKIVHYANHHPDTLTQHYYNSILGISDRESYLLLATRLGLWKFDKTTKTFSRPVSNPKDTTLLFSSTLNVLTDWPDYNYNDAWVVAPQEHAMVRFDENLSVLQKINLPDGFFKGWNYTRYERDKEGMFWFLRNNELVRFNPKDSTFTQIETIKSGLSHVFSDRDENLWVATEKGVGKMPKRALAFNNFNTSLNNIGLFRENETDYIVASQTSAQGEITDVAIAPLTSVTETLKFKTVLNSVSALSIESFFQGRNNLWLAILDNGVDRESRVIGLPIDASTGGLKSDPLITLYHDQGVNNTFVVGVVSVLEDVNSDLWMAYRSGAVDKVTLKLPDVKKSVNHFKFNNKARHFFPHKGRFFWIISNESLELIDPGPFPSANAGKVIYSLEVKELPFTMARESDSTILVGTQLGLYRLFERPNGFQFDRTPLWNKTEVKGIQIDSLGRAWLRISDGLVCYDGRRNTSTEFTKKDGIEHTGDPNIGRIFKSRNNLIFMSDLEGISIFDPQSFKVNQVMVSVALTTLSVNNEAIRVNSEADDFTISSDISVLEELTLDYLHNNFTLEFSAMEMTAPEKNLYRHKLEGYDNDWIETNYKNRTTSYTNLPSGTYTFRVKASNHHGVWSDNERTLKVIILPPPWRTWWAYTIYILTFLLALRAYSKWRERNIKREKDNLEIKVKERTHELLSTQSQLIQSEKMASLGELTAGIAHEIQNPLNFVNNFSEVNTELIDELEQEVNKGNLEEVKLLTKDIKENEQKINHHGKRAGDIVKSMLQHSRTSSGVKEPTNINALADEYLRLAYHGLRAKDKSFNATMKTDFDETIGKINVVPQDIGRVILNLITNAFYAVNEKQKHASTGLSARQAGSVGQQYEPTVSVSTKKSGDYVLISVKDNGNGIPQKVLNKIFQPFFTTKPTGQGTGLGLSLSYDIVKAHGGELSVETLPAEAAAQSGKEGEGATFIITLPAKQTGAAK